MLLCVGERRACVLSNEQRRCPLPRGVRPRYRAFYPLWFELDPLTQDVSLEVVGSRACLAIVESSADAEAILKMFGFHREEMMVLVQRSRAKIREHRTMPDETLAALALSGEEL